MFAKKHFYKKRFIYLSAPGAGSTPGGDSDAAAAAAAVAAAAGAAVAALGGGTGFAPRRA